MLFLVVASFVCHNQTNMQTDNRLQRSRQAGPWTSRRLSLLDQSIIIEGENESFVRSIARCFEAPDVVNTSSLCDLRVRLQPAAEPEACLLTSTPPEALQRLDTSLPFKPFQVASALNEWAVSSTTRYYVFHAGAVAKDGQAILMPGASRSGKTTLTTALAQAGFELLSDDP